MVSLELLRSESVTLESRQFGDCFTTCFTQVYLSGNCGVGSATDYSCICRVDSSFKGDMDTCFKNTCKGDIALSSAQTSWRYFCLYLGSGTGGLPTGFGGGGAVNLPTSSFSPDSSKPTSSSSPTGNKNGNNLGNNGGNDNGNTGSNNGGATANNQESSAPLGAIIGGAVGGVVLILMLVFMILYFRRRKTSPQTGNNPTVPFPSQFGQQQPMTQMNSGPPFTMNTGSISGGALPSPNPSYNSTTPLMNQGHNYSPTANSFTSGQGSFNNMQPMMSHMPLQPMYLSANDIGTPLSPQTYPEHTGPTNNRHPSLSPTSAQAAGPQSFVSQQSRPSTNTSLSGSDHNRLTNLTTNSQQHLLGLASYSNVNANNSISSPSTVSSQQQQVTPPLHAINISPPALTGSFPSQQAQGHLSEKQRLQIHLEYQDGAASTAGGSSGYPTSGFHVTNNNPQDCLDGRSLGGSSAPGSGPRSGTYTVTNPNSDGVDAPPLYSENS